MNLIQEIEIAYFRSFYKVTLYKCNHLNIIFGKNDVGKSNIVRALNLFFNNKTDHINEYNFGIDFSDRRLVESQNSDDVRKFIYVKITFATPKNYQRSLGESFYVKRQWTVSRGGDYHEEVSSHIRENQRHIVTRFINLFRFIYIPAIKDPSIFRSLLFNIYETLSDSDEFVSTVGDFAGRVQGLTSSLFEGLPKEIAHETKISSPSRMDELFQTLDFETISNAGGISKSLTTQRGDGIKARHIPELLNFISKRDRFQFHIWGFEEPENSLDFVAAEAEAVRLLKIAEGDGVQIFTTTHSPSFYNLTSENISRFYVTRDTQDGVAKIVQGKNLDRFDAAAAVGEGFYLPAVAKALESYSAQQLEMIRFKEEIDDVRKEMFEIKSPILLTEGKTDEIMLVEAWKRIRNTKQTFRIKSCDTGDGSGGGAAGASKLSLCLRAVAADNPHVVIGLFDRDEAGAKEWKLDNNFVANDLFSDVKSSKNGRSFGLLLPVPEFRKACAENENLPIEFLFSDEYLATVVDGRRLVLTPLTASRKLGSGTVRVPLEGGTEVQAIDENSKMVFAKTVVPKLPDEAFSAFDLIFKSVEAIISATDKSLPVQSSQAAVRRESMRDMARQRRS
ncbi:ATP-binding protein [Mesorhizobium sp. AD1-1]|uniref:ATP-dependent nuclease n=1 Tax=Mesorhizobium sp. AD1-1 TaxID=2876621 RepID=UPI001CCD8BA3|nr:AAA family ATPase [Mesorhizobium sp. AD1-1]MBZ9721948.1 ATP-binding protein [Mesorhizobium sp. AD1-1]